MTVAVVTGGSRGIGAAAALLLAGQGHDLCLSYLTDAGAAEAVADRCRAAGVEAVAVRADVAEEADVDALFGAADRLGPLGVLVNNAGIVGRPLRLEDLSAERIRRMLDVNVLGSFLCAGAAVRRMAARYGGAGGAIVNVSSRASQLGSPGEYVDYAASKGALDSMTIGLAKEVAADGIRVNAVRPGLIATEIHDHSPGRLDRLRSTIPMGRPGEAGEVADALAWLCSPAASYITGALLDIGGGR